MELILHKIVSKSDTVEVILRTPLADGPPEYTVIPLSIDEAFGWISKAQSALDAAKRERALIADRSRSEIRRQLQQLQAQVQALEAQLQSYDAPGSEDTPLRERIPDLTDPDVRHVIIHNHAVRRAGPPTARQEIGR